MSEPLLEECELQTFSSTALNKQEEENPSSTPSCGDFFGRMMKQVASLGSYFSRFSLPKFSFSQWKVFNFSSGATSFTLSESVQEKIEKGQALLGTFQGIPALFNDSQSQEKGNLHKAIENLQLFQEFLQKGGAIQAQPNYNKSLKEAISQFDTAYQALDKILGQNSKS